MLKKSLLATLLVTASLPAWALDLEPGLWGQVIESDAGNGEALQKFSRQECLTEEDAKDPEAAFRRDFSDAGFTDVEFAQNRNTVNATAFNTSGDQDVEMKITLIKHSDKHTSSTTEVISSSTSTTTFESRWIEEDC